MQDASALDRAASDVSTLHIAPSRRKGRNGSARPKRHDLCICRNVTDAVRIFAYK